MNKFLTNQKYLMFLYLELVTSLRTTTAGDNQALNIDLI